MRSAPFGMLSALAFVGLVGAAGGCSRGTDAPATTGSAVTPLAASAAPGEKNATAAATVLDFVGGFDACTLSHRGVLLDLGDPTMRARMSSTKLHSPDLEVREREGASWVDLHERNLELSFVSPSEVKSEGGIVVEARMRGGAAKSASIYLNGKAIGVMPLVKGETKVLTARAPSAGSGS